MPKICSFDVFDTLITRKVAIPHHIFLLTGIRISRDLNFKIDPKIFANARIAAEKKLESLQDTSGGIFKIYDFLAEELSIPDRIKDKILKIELDTEFENIVSVDKFVRKLEALRSEGAGIIYVSDMYLGEKIIKKILTDSGIYNKGERVFVSCDYGVDKTSGKLFDVIIEELNIQKKDLHHFGNSKKSDIQGAKIAGITSTYLDDANLNRYERHLALSCERHLLSAETCLRYSQLAAASRQARLSREDEDQHIYDISCSVAAPMLFSFLTHVLEKAKDKKIYFLARDGYIMYLIARLIKERMNLDIDINYLYISREVLVLSKFEELGYQKYIDYIAEIFSEETLKSLFKKLKISETAISKTGLSDNECNRILFDINHAELQEIFSTKEISEEVQKKSKDRKRRMLDYFETEGLLDDGKIAIVDVGWKLTIQNLLAGIFDQLDLSPPEGYYFGINESAYSSLNRGEKHGYYWDLRKNVNSLKDPKMIRIFEVFCSAPHGQTVDFKINGSSILPEFNDRETAHMINWGYKDMEQGILNSVRSILENSNFSELATPEWWDRTTVFELVSQFWFNPSRNVIQKWGEFPYNITHDGKEVVNLFNHKPFYSLLRYVIKRGKLPNSRLDHWPHAYLYSLMPYQSSLIKLTIRFKKSFSEFRKNLRFYY